MKKITFNALLNHKAHNYKPTIVVLPITSSKKPILPVHTRADDTALLTDGSIILAEQIRTIDKRRLRSYIGSLDADAMKRVDQIIKISLEVS